MTALTHHHTKVGILTSMLQSNAFGCVHLSHSHAISLLPLSLACRLQILARCQLMPSIDATNGRPNLVHSIDLWMHL